VFNINNQKRLLRMAIQIGLGNATAVGLDNQAGRLLVQRLGECERVGLVDSLNGLAALQSWGSDTIEQGTVIDKEAKTAPKPTTHRQGQAPGATGIAIVINNGAEYVDRNMSGVHKVL
jgi:hypothetical protein